jgi:hypothetical protein
MFAAKVVEACHRGFLAIRAPIKKVNEGRLCEFQANNQRNADLHCQTRPIN